MEIHRFREQQRDNHVAIESLNHQISDKQRPEISPHPPLEQCHHHHRDSNQHSADVRYKYRQANQHRQQQRIAHIHDEKHQIGRHADNNHLQHFATNIIGDLLIHLLPDQTRQTSISRQHAPHSAEHLFLIFKQEKYHHRYQNQINRQRQQAHQRREREFHQIVTHARKFGVQVFSHHIEDPGVNQCRITFRQGSGEIVKTVEHARQIGHQIDNLLPGNMGDNKDRQHHHTGENQ